MPRLRRRTALIIVAILGVASVGAYLAVGYVGMQTALAEGGGCHVEQAGFTPAAFRTDGGVSSEFDASKLDPRPYLMPNFEEVTFGARSEPGVTIHGWWIPSGDPAAPAVVVVHGENSCRRDPAILVPAGMLHREGFGVLMIDMRNNGDSARTDGRYGAGSVEYRDVLGGWDWLVARGEPQERIGLFGHSGGAPGVVVAMGEEPRVAAGWEESGPSDLGTAAAEEARRDGLPDIAVPAALFWMWAMGDDVINRSPIAEAAKLGRRPLQVVHGTADGRVAVHHARDLEAVLQRANPASEAWIIDGSHHVEGPFLHPDEYERRLGAFFHAALGS